VDTTLITLGKWSNAMSTSLLYHGFGLTQHKHVKEEYRSGAVFFHVEQKKSYVVQSATVNLSIIAALILGFSTIFQ